jgi:hypothetical protein
MQMITESSHVMTRAYESRLARLYACRPPVCLRVHHLQHVGRYAINATTTMIRDTSLRKESVCALVYARERIGFSVCC